MSRICDRCEGLGFLGSPCSECGGRPEEWEGADGGGCNTCGGNGWLEVDCPHCAGNGGTDY